MLVYKCCHKYFPFLLMYHTFFIQWSISIGTDPRMKLFNCNWNETEMFSVPQAEGMKKIKETTLPNMLENISDRLDKNEYFLGASVSKNVFQETLISLLTSFKTNKLFGCATSC